MTCKSGALALDGGNYSNMMANHALSLTSNTMIESLILQQQMPRDKQLEYGKLMVESTKSGVSLILIKLIRLKPRDSMRNSVSTLTDHST
jgi:hypothetical protein